MKVTGINSAELVGALYEQTAQTSKKKDGNSIENLLSANMSANNSALTRLANKAQNTDYYKKTLEASECSGSLLRQLNDAKKSVFVKAGQAQDETEKEAYQSQAAGSIADLLSSYNTMITNLLEAGGKTNKNFLRDLNELMRKNESALDELGISRREDGTLALNAEKLAATDLETMERVFGAESEFAGDLLEQIDTITDKTATTVGTLQIYSTAYSNSGSYSQYEYLEGMYDLKA